MSTPHFQIEREYDGEWFPTYTPYSNRITEEEVIETATWLAKEDHEGKERRVTTVRNGRKVVVHTTEVHSAGN